jgi:hypothetical protein
LLAKIYLRPNISLNIQVSDGIYVGWKKNQRAASSVVYSDLYNLNRTVYVCIFLYKIILICYKLSYRAPSCSDCVQIFFLLEQFEFDTYGNLHDQSFELALWNQLCTFFMTATLYPCISWLIP